MKPPAEGQVVNAKEVKRMQAELRECLMEFVRRVTSNNLERYPAEIEILPEIVRFLLTETSTGLTSHEMRVLRDAIHRAHNELTMLHGLRVTDNADSGATWELNNDDALKEIDEAIEILAIAM